MTFRARFVLQGAMQQPPHGPSILFLIAIVSMIVAVARSRQKLVTIGVFASVLIGCFLIGLAIAVATRSPQTGGMFIGILMPAGAIAASIDRIRRDRKARPKLNIKPL